jgi:outer membrane protein
VSPSYPFAVPDLTPLPIRWARVGVALTLLLVGGSVDAHAQQKIGYIDSGYVLDQMPEYAAVQQKLDQLEQQWRQEIEAAEKQVETLEQEFQARELLYTDEERKRKRGEIRSARQKVERLRQRYFGPEGELYSRQKSLMRPLQERILKATEEVAQQDGYDYIFDKGDEVLFMYAREEHNVSDAVLRELGINVDQQGGRP